jgi:hypothetical protein
VYSFLFSPTTNSNEEYFPNTLLIVRSVLHGTLNQGGKLENLKEMQKNTVSVLSVSEEVIIHCIIPGVKGLKDA